MFHPGRGHSGSEPYPQNTGCEVGIHTKWDARSLQGIIHTHTNKLFDGIFFLNIHVVFKMTHTHTPTHTGYELLYFCLKHIHSLYPVIVQIT